MSVAKSSFWFSAGTLLSRASGLVRDAIFVGVFGASVLHDAFLIAFRIPNLLREMFAEGALGSSFTTVYSALCATDRERAQRMFLDMLYFCFIFSTLLAGLGILLSPELVHLMTLMTKDGGDPSFIANTIGLTRLLFPYLCLTILGAVVMGVLHQRGRFFLSAMSPIAFNVGNILGAVALAPLMAYWAPAWVSRYLAEPSIVGLAMGVLLGGVMQLGWQIWGVWSEVLGSVRFSPLHWPWSADVKKVVTLMLPAALAASTGPVNIFVNTNFATQVGPGAVTWLNYAFRLLQLPIGVFGVAVSAAVLPRLARALANSPKGVVTLEAAAEFENAVELVLWLIVPCTLFLALEHQQIITLLFEHGKFSAYDSIQTSSALFAYSFGLVGYALIKVLTTFYYAVERTGYAMRVALVCMVINYVGNLLFVDRFGHIGLAMTSSLVLSANAAILLVGIARHYSVTNKMNIVRSLSILFVGAGMVVILQKLCAPLMAVLQSAAPSKALALFEIVVCGVGILLCFSMAGLWRLQKNPRQALTLVRERLLSGGRKVKSQPSKPTNR